MKTIYLLVAGEGYKAFDFDAEETKKELSDRGITIGHEASIGNEASIGHRASIGHGASIGHEASIKDGASIVKTIFITGTRHTVNWYGEDNIHIGCHSKKISWWKKNYKMIGEKEGYSEAEIKEYYEYIKICETLQKSI